MSDRESQLSVPRPEGPARVRPHLRQRSADGRRRRIFSWVLVAGAAALLVDALVGDNGYLAAVRARHERAALAAEVMKLQAANEELTDEARRLQDDPAAVEDAARRDLGLIRPGETLVIIRDAKTPNH
jgi:cell division protein FtsB